MKCIQSLTLALLLLASPALAVEQEYSAAKQSVGGQTLLDTASTFGRTGQWFVQNQSAATLYVQLDDAVGTTGTASTITVYVLDPAAGGVGHQGGGIGSSDTGLFTGRIRVYGPASSQHSLRVQ